MKKREPGHCPLCGGLASVLSKHVRHCYHCGLEYLVDSVTWCPIGDSMHDERITGWKRP